MALQKTPVTVNFNQGVDTKSDPKQVQVGKFLTLVNSVFDETGALKKRNGYPQLTSLPNRLQTTLTTLNDNLLATGINLYAYSQDINTWSNQGSIQPVSLNTMPLVRVSTPQSQADCAVASNGLLCTTYIDSSVSYYQITDSSTGQQVIGRTALPSTATSPRVFILGRYFIISFLVTVAASTHLRYISIPIASPTLPSIAIDISSVVESLTTGYDGYVAAGVLYFAWTATSTAVRCAYLNSSLVLSFPVTISSHRGDLISVTADTTTVNTIVYVTYWDTNTNNGYTTIFNNFLATLHAATLTISNIAITTLTSAAVSGVNTILYEVDNTYSFSPNAQSDYIDTVTITQTGAVGTPTTILRSVGLASKAFVDGSKIYALVAYGETNQPTYFLIDSSGNISLRLAYSNGGGYITGQVLPSVTALNSEFYIAYLYKDFLTTINKGTNNPSGTPSNAIYSQLGINLAKLTINMSGQYSSEIASALHLTGGQLWEYDGVKPVEHGFHVWPENIAVSTATGSGSITAGTYYYIFTYEWTDNAGNLHRSAPSIPIKQTTSTTQSTNTLHVPTLRLTYKISPNPVRIVGYRWSVAQQTYYQFTSVTSPTLNSTTTDSVTITDTLADSAILGNTLLYTTGGVIENIAAPASVHSCLFKSRLFLIDAEDQNLLWYSKQVIETTPVEMSDLFTIYVAPTSGAQGSTGPMKALSAMDDKLIIFKKDAIYYMTGTGPDNTGSNNDFSDPVYVTGSVGCSNPSSIVLMPNGIMFQSDKGIWLLDRGLNTSYIGSPVEGFNTSTIRAAQTIPGTNQVRFILDNGVTLMYDYFQQQWGTFTNVNAISATLYQSKHTYLNDFGKVYQETTGMYQDGSNPVLMSFSTSWMSLAGLRGYERFYFMYLLGTYYTPFKLNVQLTYDYDINNRQNIVVTPDNYTAPWGGDASWGSGQTWGGPGNVFEARIFPQTQKCQTFQVTVNEVYDSSFNVAPGQGLTLSGLNLVVGVKKGYPTQKASRSFG